MIFELLFKCNFDFWTKNSLNLVVQFDKIWSVGFLHGMYKKSKITMIGSVAKSEIVG